MSGLIQSEALGPMQVQDELILKKDRFLDLNLHWTKYKSQLRAYSECPVFIGMWCVDPVYKVCNFANKEVPRSVLKRNI